MARLALSLLGPFQASLDGHPVTEFRSDKARALLAYLALEAGRPHRREALAGLLWPEAPEQTARSNLRLTLHRLRQAIGDSGPEPAYLLVTPDAAQFNLTADVQLDVATFSGLVEATTSHAHRRLEVCPDCLPRLRAAAELYRGDLLQDFFLPDCVAFAEWTLIRREGLHRQALRALYVLAEHHRQRGEHARALQYATRQLELEPWREEAHRQAMSSLALSGERSAALAQYAACRRLLADELQADPSAETQALAERIRALDVGQAAPRLPPQPTPVIGRSEELAAISGLLADPDCRLVTLLGAGGIGKTRLALQAAEAQAKACLHGAGFVPLAGVDSARALPEAILSALGLALAGRAPPLAQLLEQLRARQMLLVLDSFEHLLDGAELVSELLAAAPEVKVLVTSRERLALREEWVFDVAGLACPPDGAAARIEHYGAVQLFVECARRVQPRFALSAAEAPAVARICQITEGMPLALELAAAWVRMVPCAVIAQEIEHNLSFLSSQWRNVPDRHRSVRAAFDHSWRLLAAAEQRALRQLAVFQGGFGPEAAAQVAGASVSLLSALVDKSLIRQADSRDGPRYDLHELIRQYALEHLRAAGEAEAVRNRHAAFHLQLAEAGEAGLSGAEQAAWVARLEREHDNVRASLRWCLEAEHRAPDGLRLAAAMAHYWGVRGYLAEGRHWLEAALAQAPGAPAGLRARALNGTGRLAFLQSDYAVARARYEASIALCREGRDLASLAAALNGLGAVLTDQNEYAAAQALCAEALDLARRLEDLNEGALALNNLGLMAWHQDDYAAARRLLEESVALRRQTGNQHGVAYGLNNLGLIALYQGEPRLARALFEESLSIRRLMGDRRGTAFVLGNLGLVALAEDELDSAQQLLEESLALRRALGDKRYIANVLGNLGVVAQLRGELRSAREHYTEGLKLARQLRDQTTSANLLGFLGSLSLDEGDDAAARLWLEESRQLRAAVGSRRSIANSLNLLGRLASRTGDYGAARRLFEESRQLAQSVGSRPGEADALLGLTLVAAAEGRGSEARSCLRESLVVRWELGSRRGVAEALERVAALAASEDRLPPAVRLLGAAQALRAAIGVPVPPAERAEHEALGQGLRARLGEAAFAAEWQAGHALAPAQAVEQALTELDRG